LVLLTRRQLRPVLKGPAYDGSKRGRTTIRRDRSRKSESMGAKRDGRITGVKQQRKFRTTHDSS